MAQLFKELVALNGIGVGHQHRKVEQTPEGQTAAKSEAHHEGTLLARKERHPLRYRP
jgi:hypothetical protein